MTRWCGTRVGLLLLTLTTVCATAAGPRRVLLLHSYGRDFAPFNTIPGVFRAELVRQSQEPVDFYEASLESARFNDPSEEGPLVNYLRAVFQGRRLDLLVPIGGPATRFAQRHRRELFPGTPMVIAGTDQRHLKSAVFTTNDTAVAMWNEPSRVIETLLQLLPQTTNIAVVIGNSPLEQFWLGELRSEFQLFTNRVRFDWLNGLPFGEMLNRCAVLPPRSAIFMPLLVVDIEGAPQMEERVLPQLHEAANAPLFGIWSSQLGQGVVGGPLMDLDELSRNTARIAARILRGEAPGDIRVPPQKPGTPRFDWRELRRWSISEARLPAGSVIQFHQPGFWERYRWPIASTVLLCLLQAALILTLLVNRAKRRQGEAEAALIADISSKFVNLPPGEVDREIVDAQRRICALLGLDFSALWEWLDEPPGLFTLTHFYGAQEGPQPSERMNQDQYPWARQQLLAGRIIKIASLEEMPAEAARDRESLRQFGIRSNLALPLLVGGEPPVGILGLGTTRTERDWPDALVKRLQLVAQIFASALARKRADQALRASEELNRITFEQAAIGIAHVGTDGRWLRVNDRLCAIVGYPRDELMKLTFQEITHPEDLKADLNSVRQVLSGEIKNYSLEKRYIRKDRSPVWVILTVSLVQTAAGAPLHFIAVIEDITERKQAEAELLRQRAELAHVARVSTMGELAASVAHELNQPLGAILANAEAAELFLQQNPPALDEVRAIVADIRKDDERAGEVIRRMRALLRKHELERQPLEINSLAEDVLQLVSGDAALRGVALTADLGPMLPKVSGDRIHLQQVLLNLMLNGMDAMAGQARDRRRILVRTRLGADGWVELAVVDSGHGIEPDKLPRLFEPFYTTKPNGMGMGLSIARTIVEAHKGRIWAENNPSGGAVFRIALPALREQESGISDQ
jgi:PAS domain S-box-containing protein